MSSAKLRGRRFLKRRLQKDSVFRTQRNGMDRRRRLRCEILESRQLLAGPDPDVVSIARASPDPTNADQVTFQVNFDEAVSGVETSDFNLETVGLTGSAIIGVSGTQSVYEVTVGTGSGEGTIKLNLIDDDSIVDSQGKSLGGSGTTGSRDGSFFAGEVFTVDKVIPATLSIVRSQSNPALSTTVEFAVNFSETVVGVDTTDFELAITGLSSATIDAVNGSGAGYTVIASYTGSAGTIGLNLDDDNSIVDAAGNQLGGAAVGDGDFTGESYNVGGLTINGTVRFDQDGDGLVDSDDFGVAGQTVFVDINQNGVFDAGEPQAVTVADDSNTTEIDESGSYTLVDLPTNQANILVNVNPNQRQSNPVAPGTNSLDWLENHPSPEGVSAALPRDLLVTPDGNQAVGVYQSGQHVVLYDRDPIDGRLQPIDDIETTGLQGGLYGALSPQGRYVYIPARNNDAISVLEISGNSLNAIQTVSSASLGNSLLDDVDSVEVNPQGDMLVASSGYGDRITIFQIDSATGMLSLVESWTNGVELTTLDNPGQPRFSKDGTKLFVSAWNSSRVNVFDVNLASRTLQIAQPAISIGSPSSVVVAPDDSAIFVSTWTGRVYTIQLDTDSNQFGVVSTVFLPATVDPYRISITPDGSTIFLASWYQNSISRLGVASDGISLTLEDSVRNGIELKEFEFPSAVVISPDGRNAYVPVRNYNHFTNFWLDSGEGLSVPRHVVGAVGTTVSGINFMVTTDAPRALSIDRLDGPVTANAQVQFGVTFSEPVTGVTSDDFQLVLTDHPSATIDAVSGGPTDYVVNATVGEAEGNVAIELIDDGSIYDIDSTPIGEGTGAILGRSEVTYADRIAPMVDSITSASNPAAGVGSYDFYVTFPENVSGVDSNDFVLTWTGFASASVAGVTVRGNVATVSVDFAGVAGTLQIDVVDDDTIVDLAGNPLGGPGVIGLGDGSVAGSMVAIGLPTISGRIFSDVDQDGFFDGGEFGRIDTTVYIDANFNGIFDVGETSTQTSSDNPDTTDVDEGGYYEFVDLSVDAAYSIRIVADGLQQTAPLAYATADGTLTFEDSVVASTQPNNYLYSANSVTVSPDGRHVYTTAINGHALTVFARDSLVGISQPVEFYKHSSPGFDGLSGPKDFVLSSDGRIGYLISKDHIHVVARNPNDGTLSVIQQVQDGEGGIENLVGLNSAVLTPDGRTLFVSAATADTIFVFEVDVNAGTLSLRQQVANFTSGATALDSPAGLAVSPDGLQLFVSGYYDSTVSVFDVVPGGGVLPNPVQFEQIYNVDHVAISSDGADLYATQSSGRLEHLRRNTSTGQWERQTDFSLPTGSAHHIEISPDGQFVYVANRSADAINVLQRDPNLGTLTHLQTLGDVAPHDKLDYIQQVVITPDGTELFAVAWTDNALSRFSRVQTATGPGDVLVQTRWQSNTVAPIGVFNEVPQAISLATAFVSPSNAETVDYTLVFNEPVSGVDLADFTLMPTTLAGAAVTAVIGGPEQYTVSVSTGSGVGTLQLVLLDDDSIVDAAGDPIGGRDANHSISSSVLAVDRDVPTVVSITRSDPSPTIATSMVFEVIFSESVTLPVAADFQIVLSGIGSASIDSISGADANYFVALTHSGGQGTVGLDFLDRDTVQDLASNPTGGLGLGNGDFFGEFYEVTPPIVRGLVFDDMNGNGIQDATETGIPGVTVYLDINENGARDPQEPFAITTVDDSQTNQINESGQYELTHDSLGVVALSIEGLPSGAHLTSPVTYPTATGRLELADQQDSSSVPAAILEPYDVEISPDGQLLLLSSDLESTGGIAVYSRDDTGQLTFLSWLVTDGVNLQRPRDLEFAPDGQSVYVQDMGASEIVQFSIDANSGALTRLNAFDLLDITNSVGYRMELMINPSGTTLFASSEPLNRVSMLDIDPNDGSLSHRQSFIDGVGGVSLLRTPKGMELSADEQFLYVTAFSEGGVSVFQRDDSTGDWSLAQSISGINVYPSNPELSGDGRWLQIATYDFSNPNAFHSYPVDTVTGQLGPPVVSAIPVRITQLIDGPVSDHLNFLSESHDQVGTVQFDSVSGTATVPQVLQNVLDLSGMDQPRAAVVSSDGRAFYVAASGSDTLLQFNRDLGAPEGSYHSVVLVAGEQSSTFDFALTDPVPMVQAVISSPVGPTSSDTLLVSVEFSEGITGFAQSLLSLSNSTLTAFPNARIDSVASLGLDRYQVAISGLSGSGQVELRLQDDDSIVDSTSQPLNGTGTQDIDLISVQVDNVNPMVIELSLETAAPVTTTQATINVSFNEAVTGLHVSDFTLSGDVSVTGFSVVEVTGSGSSYQVVVNTGQGDGNLTLNLIDNDSVVDSIGNPLGGVGSGNGAAGPLSFELVKTGVIAGELFHDVNHDGVLDATEIGVDGVTVYVDLNQNGVLDGSSEPSTVTQVDDPMTVENELGVYELPGIAPGNYQLRVQTSQWDLYSGTTQVDFIPVTVQVGQTTDMVGALRAQPPYALSISHAPSSPTDADTLTFTVTFDRPVSQVDVTDFALLGSAANSVSLSSVTGAGAVYDIQVDLALFASHGDLQLRLDDDDSIIASNGASLGGAGTAADVLRSPVVQIDRDNPQVVSITAASPIVIGNDDLVLTVTFSEPVSGVDVDDLTLVSSGVTGATIASVTEIGDGMSYSVVVSSGTNDGSLQLALNDNDSIVDSLQHPLNGPGQATSYALSEVIPVERDPRRSVMGVVFDDVNDNGVRDSGEDGAFDAFVYLDLNQNAFRDANEPFLRTPEDDPQTTEIDEAGVFSFDGVPLGTFDVAIKDLWFSYLSSPNHIITVELDFDDHPLVVDVPATKNRTSIQGVVYEDLNGNGVRDTGEPGIAGQRIYRDNNNNDAFDAIETHVLTTADDLGTPEDESGRYSISPVPFDWDPFSSDLFTYRIDLDSVWVPRSSVETSRLYTAPDQVEVFDVGLTPNNTVISGVVFDDLDANGIQEGNDVPVAGWIVFIDSDFDGVRDSNEKFSTTLADNPATMEVDETGSYQFSQLQPGNHRVVIEPKTGFVSTSDSAVLVELIDSNSTGSVDFAIHTNQTAVTGIAFDDQNGDGIQDLGEVGFAGVTVYVDQNDNGRFDPGEVSATTDAAGQYQLSAVSPGEVVIRIVEPLSSVVTSPANAQTQVYLMHGFGQVQQVDPTTGIAIRDAFVGGPYEATLADSALAFDGQWLYASSYMPDQSPAVTLIDPVSLEAFDRFPVAIGNAAEGAAVIGDQLYLLNAVNDVIYGYDLATRSQTAALSIPTINAASGYSSTELDLAYSLGESADGSMLLVRNLADSVLTIDPSTGVVISSFAVPTRTMRHLGLAGTGGSIYLSHDSPGRLSTLGASGNVVETENLSCLPGSAAAGTYVDHSYTLTVELDQSYIGNDFGIQSQLRAVSGTQFIDSNGNGQLDVGEPPLAGVTVYIDLNGNQIFDPSEPSAVSDADGNYSIPETPIGAYWLRRIWPIGYQPNSYYSSLQRLYGTNDNPDLTSLTGEALGIREIDPATGTLLGQIQTDIPVVWPNNATTDGQFIYTIDNDRDVLIQLTPAGVFVREIPIPQLSSGVIPYSQGPAYVDGILYWVTGNEFKIRDLDAQSGVLSNERPITIAPHLQSTLSFIPASGNIVESPNDQFIWMFVNSDDRILVLDPKSAQIVDLFHFPKSQTGYWSAASLNGEFYFRNSATGGVLEVYDANLNLLRTIPDSDSRGLAAATFVEYGTPIDGSGDFTLSHGYRSVYGMIAGVVGEDLDGNGVVTGTESVMPGVTVFIDTNRNGLLDHNERSTTSDSSGSYLFTDVFPGDYSIATITPEHFHPSDAYPDLGRLFGVELYGDSASPTGYFAELRELDPVTGVVLDHRITDVPLTNGAIGLAFDGEDLILVDNANDWIYVLDTQGRQVQSRRLGEPYTSQTSGQTLYTAEDDQGPAVVGGTIYSVRNSQGIDLVEYDKHSNEFLRRRPISFDYGLSSLPGTYQPTVPEAVESMAVALDGQSILISASDDRVFTLDPITAIATFDPQAANNQPVDYAMATLSDERYVSYAGQIQVRNESNQLVRTLSGWPTQYGLGAGQQRIAGQVVSVSEAGVASADLGFVSTLATLSGSITDDTNGNRQVDTGEIPAEGWTVYLDLNRDGQLDSGEPQSTTSADGAYLFSGLVPGEYEIRVDVEGAQYADAWTEDSMRLFVYSKASSGEGEIHELDARTGRILNRFESPLPENTSVGMALSGDWLFLVSGNEFYILDADSGSQIDSFRVNLPGLDSMAIIGNLAYVANSLVPEVHVIDLAQRRVIDRLDLGSVSPGYAMGEAPDGRNLLVASSDSVDVHLLDPVTGDVLETYPNIYPGGGAAGAGSEVFERGFGSFGGMTSILVRDHLLLPVRHLPFPIVGELYGLAAQQQPAQRHLVRLYEAQIETQRNFGIIDNPIQISGTQFVDQNENGIFDFGEKPLPGVTVFVDFNANHWPDPDEPQAISDLVGHYQISGVHAGVHSIQTLTPADYAPSRHAGSVDRIFSTFLLSDPSSSTGRRLGIHEIDPVDASLIATHETMIETSYPTSTAYDGSRLYVTDNSRDQLLELTVQGDLISEVDLPSGTSATTALGPVVVGAEVYVLTVSGGLPPTLWTYDKQTKQFVNGKPLDESGNSLANSPFYSIALAESPDGKSIVAFNNINPHLFVIDPMTARVTKGIPRPELEDYTYSATSLNGELFVSSRGSSGYIDVYDAEFQRLRTLGDFSRFYDGLAAGRETSAGLTVTLSAGSVAGNLDFGYQSLVARDGDLVRSFADDGVVVTEFFHNENSYEQAVATAVDMQDRILSVGEGGYLVRYDSDGSIDTTFGTDGSVRFAGSATDVNIQDDGRIVVVGSNFDGRQVRVVLSRYLADGTPDPSFGAETAALVEGQVITLIEDTRLLPTSLQFADDGKMVVAGQSREIGASENDLFVARYHSDGTIDLDFGTDGIVVSDLGGFETASAHAVSSDGKIIVVGGSDVSGNQDFAVVRYTADGSLDPSFDEDGFLLADFGGAAPDEAFAVAMTSDDKFIVAGTTAATGSSDLAIAKFNSDGSLDASFSGDGLLSMDFLCGHDVANGLVIDEVGKILITGQSDPTVGPSKVLVARFTQSGTLDTAFNSVGFAKTTIDSDDAGGFDVEIDSHNRLVIAGYVARPFDATHYDVALLRFADNGSADTTFGTDGVTTTALKYSDDRGQAVLKDPSGGFFIGGSSVNRNEEFAIARYHDSGELDRAFGGNGTVTTLIGSGNATVIDLAIDADRKVIAAGQAVVNNDVVIALARYNRDGTLDTTFGVDGIVTSHLGISQHDVTAVEVDTNGNILVLGRIVGADTPSDAFLMRFDDSGVIDPAFATSGVALQDLGGADVFATDMTIRSDEKIVVTGVRTVAGDSDFAIWQYSPDGILDEAFGTSGWTVTNTGTDSDYAQAVALQADGKAVVGGLVSVNGQFDFALARYQTDGILDASFGTNGLLIHDIAGVDDLLRDLAITVDNRIAVVGSTNSGANYDLAVARFLPDGPIDESFGIDGSSVFQVGPGDDFGRSIAVADNSDLMVAGHAVAGASWDFTMLRIQDSSYVDVHIDGAGNLVVNQGQDGSSRTIRTDGNSVFVEEVGSELLTVVPGSSGSGTSRLTVPLSSFSGSILYRAGAGEQIIEIDLSTGLFTRTVDIFGGDGQDHVVISGAAVDSTSMALSEVFAGVLTVTGSEPIELSGIESVQSAILSQHVNVSYAASPESFVIFDEGVGRTRIESTVSASFSFLHPSESLSFDSGSGADDISIVGLPSLATAGIAIDDGGLDDQIRVTGAMTLASASVNFAAATIDLEADFSTGGGDVNWLASGDIMLQNALNTADGNVQLKADADQDGNGSFFLAPVQSLPLQSDFLLTAPDADVDDWFGSSVAIEGDTVVVAADGDSDNGPSSGSLYIYNRTGGSWSLTQKITPDDGATLDYFGYPLAISGDTIVAAATLSDSAAVDAGAVYVYRRIGDTWALEQKLTASDAGLGDQFGDSLAIDGDTIVVAAPKDDDAGNDAGSAYIFTRIGNTWTQQQKVTASDALPDAHLGNTNFGNAIALEGKTFVIGSQLSSHYGTGSGAAYVFEEVGGLWQETQRLTAFIPTASEAFGISVALREDTILVGSDLHDGDYVNSGAVYEFARQGQAWTPKTKIVQDTPAQSDRFGFALAFDGDRALISSISDERQISMGTVYAFARYGDAWIQESKFQGDGGSVGDQYGHALAIEGATALVGSYNDHSPINDAGSVYFYEQASVSGTNGSIQSGSGDVSITAASLDLLGTVNASQLHIQASQPDASIHLGGGSGTFLIDDYELSQVDDRVSAISIGDPLSRTQQIIVESATFSDPVSLFGFVSNEQVDGANVTAPALSVSGEITPGNSPGILTFHSSLLIDSSSSVRIEVAGDGSPGANDGHDQLSVSGRVDIGGQVTLELVGGNAPESIESLALLVRDGGSGVFEGLPEGHLLTNPFGNGQDFRLTYAGGDGDDLVLRAQTAPQNIALSTTTIDENQDTSATDWLLASLSADDPDPNETHAYALVAGDGDVDNSRFRVVDDKLYLKQGQQLDYELQQTLSIRLQVVDSQGLLAEQEIEIQVNNLVEVESSDIAISSGVGQRSRVDGLSIQFDAHVEIVEGAFRVTSRHDQQEVQINWSQWLDANGHTIVDLEFSGAQVESDSLVDGNYLLQIDGSKVISMDGHGFDSNGDGTTGDLYIYGDQEADGFFRLLGDSDGDRDVDLQDIGHFASSLNSSLGDSAYLAEFDFDDDGDVDANDLQQIQRRMMRRLAY